MSGSSLLVAVNALTLKRLRLPEALPTGRAASPRRPDGGCRRPRQPHDPPWPGSCITELALTVNRGAGARIGILRGPYAATGEDRGVTAQRAGALERAALVLADFQQALAALAEVEGRMAMVLAELGLAELVTSIRGVSVVGAAAILAETGDPARFDDAKAVAGHAGLCPRDNASGAFAAKTTISGRGAGRCCGWPPGGRCGAHNPVFAACYAHPTSRQRN
jgi:transposase